MAKRGRFRSFLVYLVGLLVIGGAAFSAVLLWQQKDARLVASRQALAEEVAQGPAVQVATIAQGPKERQIPGRTRSSRCTARSAGMSARSTWIAATT
jgi:hypothetical protein